MVHLQNVKSIIVPLGKCNNLEGNKKEVNKYLCLNARRSSLALTSFALLIVEGGVKQSH